MKFFRIAVWLAIVAACCVVFLASAKGGVYDARRVGEEIGAGLALFVIAMIVATITYWVSPKTRATPILTPVMGGALAALAFTALNYAGIIMFPS